ncbi:MAG: hypothetical protein J0I41_21020 [Filimonas sp.]|nr:hypothetical protein [Filimonas sp.]
MKLLLAALLVLNSSFITDNLSDRLCKDNEEIVFSFKLTKNKKVVSICKDKKERYIVYRFGTKDSVELIYPKSADQSSWKNFKYYSLHRSGGKSNAAFGDISLSFVNDNIEYSIYHTWRSEAKSNEIGIALKINKQVIKLKGEISSQIGALQDLDFSDFIKNQAEE